MQIRNLAMNSHKDKYTVPNHLIENQYYIYPNYFQFWTSMTETLFYFIFI